MSSCACWRTTWSGTCARGSSPCCSTTSTKDASKQAQDGLPLHSFRTLLKDLGTLAYNITHTALYPEAKITLTTRPTPLQAKAFKLPGLNPACTQ